MISRKAQGMSSAAHIYKSQQTGQSGERRFYDSCKVSGKDIKKTSAADDMGHVDFVVNGVTFDVKGIKDSTKEGNILLELKNVQGKSGWCNKESKPQWIAFDFGATFLCVKNLDLYKLAYKVCDFDDTVTKAKDCLYKAYTRKGRKDLMTMVKLEDVLTHCEYRFLPYQEYSQPMELL